ncbi:MAG: hypothetical protein L0H79_02980 [Intrasporangium sp.]|uniref:hypothetical protein n=1 Tax=Intrasporangium sp. TaxID=1925024 RepID=UPI002647E208|nr:hypothetical protein [Intrasporangium sp.]MDN5794700.1 hypothetical protein [Intrasporangium sp.]
MSTSTTLALPTVDTRGHAAAILYEAAVATLAALPADHPLRGRHTGLFRLDPQIRAA